MHLRAQDTLRQMDFNNRRQLPAPSVSVENTSTKLPVMQALQNQVHYKDQALINTKKFRQDVIEMDGGMREVEGNGWR